MGDDLLEPTIRLTETLKHRAYSVETPPCAGYENKLADTQVRPAGARHGCRACALRQEAESRSLTEYRQFASSE